MSKQSHGNLKKKLNKLAIRLLHGGVYPQFDIYFDDYHYDLEPYVFACGALFEETKICTEDLLLKWISQYGLMRTFTLIPVVQKKNKNLVMVKRIPKIKDQQVREKEINKFENEKKDIEKRASKYLNITANLTKTALTQAKTFEMQANSSNFYQSDVEAQKAVLTSQVLQLSNYLNSLGYTASFDVSNTLIICHPKTGTETETEESQKKKQKLE